MKMMALLVLALSLSACGTVSSAGVSARGVVAARAEAAAKQSSAAKQLAAVKLHVASKLAAIAAESYRKLVVTRVDASETQTPGAYTFTAQVTVGSQAGEQSGTFEAATGRMNILIDTTLVPAPIPSSFR